MAGALGQHVSAFVEGVGADLAALSDGSFESECTREAADVVAAVLEADGRFTDDELRAWIDELGTRLEPPVIVTPDRLRAGGLLRGAARFVDRPSTMFDVLAAADARDGGERARRYYDLALRLAHATAAVDLVPSPDEIAAIDRFRTTLLAAFDARGLPRPGRRPTPAAHGRDAAADTAAAPPADRPPDRPPARPLEELLAELDALVGLEAVKRDVRQLTSLLRIQRLRAERGLPTVEVSNHLVFTGNPGTGKTTVARLLSQILRTLGIVSSGHLVETDRSGLVAGYVGQTATKTVGVLRSALGGTLLIDEAYALARGGEHDFGREAIDALVKFMEDHRTDISIIAAGYPEEMSALVDSNPGLASRFTRTVRFPDYTDDELLRIFDLMSGAQRYHLDDGGRARLAEVITAEPRTRGFGNARFVRNVFEQAVALQATRLASVEHPTDEQLTTLTAADITSVEAA